MIEKDSIVAFIDVLGFKEIMLSDDKERRAKAIQLLKRISSYGATHGVQTESLGLGSQIILNPEVTTFSDNVVLSFPVAGVQSRVHGGVTTHPATSFLTELINLLISIYWQGLHLGLLFRGAVTTGRLYHDGNVVAGEGLVKAVRMEKATKWPRIEIDSAILNKADEHGQVLLDEWVRKVSIVEDDGRYFLDTLGFHIGVWYDYNHFAGKTESSWSEVREALNRIREQIRANIELLESSIKFKTADELERAEEALSKCIWFRDAFEAAQARDIWQRHLNQ